MALNNAQINFVITRHGKNGRATMAATKGHTATIHVTSQTTTPAGQSVTYTLFAPDGTQLASGSTSTASLDLTAANLPVTGTYTIFVDPANGATVSTSLSRVLQ